MDLVRLNGTPALHVVDIHNSFQNARFILDKTAKRLYRAFTKCWSTVYLRLPNVLRREQEAAFHSDAFKALAESHGVSLKIYGVESHNSLGKGQRYHAPLRSI